METILSQWLIVSPFFLWQGQFFSAGEGVRIYLLGNPIIWWSNLVFMAFYLTLFVVKSIRDRRGIISSPRQLGKL